MIEAVDLFCGAGGLTAGLQKSGIKVHAGYDIEATCSYAYSYNNNSVFVQKDISEVDHIEISSWFKNKDNFRLLAGCAPCQPFSTYNQSLDIKRDEKWSLMASFSKLITSVLPEFVTMENVPDVSKYEIYKEFVSALEENGYYVTAGPVSCADYGLPQLRRRHVLLASKLGPIQLLPPTHKGRHITVRDAIASLPKVNSGECDPHDPLHKASKLNDLNMRRIRASTQGSSWKDWPEELINKCHKKSTGHSYPSVYGRMSWDLPSPTMTTLCYGYGNGRFGHPTQDRAITLREAAMLQTFPQNYVFVKPGKPVNFKTTGRMIGNAVPVKLGEVIGASFNAHIRGLKKNN